jgi:hypothetical protein
MRRLRMKRHRPEEVVARLRQADEALAKGAPISSGAGSPRGVRGVAAPLAGRVRGWTGMRFAG